MFPSPDVDDLKTYSETLAQGRLLVRRCNKCGEHHHYPRSYCPFCGNGDTGWTESSGTGEIYAFTRWRQRDKVTVPAFVSLPEGPSVLGLIADCDPEALRIGDRVRLAETQTHGSMPVFTRDI
ncbi:MAG TPA: OB-fold domain-containing protein [Rhizorhapis sp.]|nr:OB-fold domain-containing protein [Rhizorhapis sp.]